jgi:hypothetical protein
VNQAEINMDRELTQITYCYYIDRQGNEYFGVTDFIRHHNLPDNAQMRLTIAEDIKEISPGLLILEEQD